MICPNCFAQMHQYKKVGGGKADKSVYSTWEIKECPVCFRLVKESYQCSVISKKEVEELEDIEPKVEILETQQIN